MIVKAQGHPTQSHSLLPPLQSGSGHVWGNYEQKAADIPRWKRVVRAGTNHGSRKHPPVTLAGAE